MDDKREDPYESFKIISKKALADYHKAERIFLEFLGKADVWSQEQVTATIIDFHLVEKCRTKFRAFVKGYGARVKFEPVEGAPKKQEYHGTVTVNRACKQQYLTQHPQTLKLASPGSQDGDADGNAPAGELELQLQCAAPVPITTGAQHIPYSEDASDLTERHLLPAAQLLQESMQSPNISDAAADGRHVAKASGRKEDVIDLCEPDPNRNTAATQCGSQSEAAGYVGLPLFTSRPQSTVSTSAAASTSVAMGIDVSAHMAGVDNTLQHSLAAWMDAAGTRATRLSHSGDFSSHRLPTVSHPEPSDPATSCSFRASTDGSQLPFGDPLSPPFPSSDGSAPMKMRRVSCPAGNLFRSNAFLAANGVEHTRLHPSTAGPVSSSVLSDFPSIPGGNPCNSGRLLHRRTSDVFSSQGVYGAAAGEMSHGGVPPLPGPPHNRLFNRSSISYTGDGRDKLPLAPAFSFPSHTATRQKRDSTASIGPSEHALSLEHPAQAGVRESVRQAPPTLGKEMDELEKLLGNNGSSASQAWPRVKREGITPLEDRPLPPLVATYAANGTATLESSVSKRTHSGTVSPSSREAGLRDVDEVLGRPTHNEAKLEHMLAVAEPALCLRRLYSSSPFNAEPRRSSPDVLSRPALATGWLAGLRPQPGSATDDCYLEGDSFGASDHGLLGGRGARLSDVTGGHSDSAHMCMEHSSGDAPSWQKGDLDNDQCYSLDAPCIKREHSLRTA